ncbi:MAG: ferredoxin [Acidimicrobiales bacterium]
MPWITRGLREGVVTSRYPRRPDGYGPGWRGAVRVTEGPVSEGPATEGPATGGPATDPELAGLCPTGAIFVTRGRVSVDRGRCILCGRCAESRPEVFSFDPSPEVAALHRRALVVPFGGEDDGALDRVRSDLAARVRTLRRSVHVRHVDAGSDGSDEWEVAALTNPVYDVQRLGIFFTASPRHADILLVTGAGASGMAGPLRRTYESMPDPRVVVAAGTDAVSGGLVHPTYATLGGIGELVPVDVWVPGSPPSPFSLLHGILLGIGLVPGGRIPGRRDPGRRDPGRRDPGSQA